MLETLGSVTGSPWIYAVIALSVLLDVFVPLLPSGILLVAATSAIAGTSAPGVPSAAAAGDLPGHAGNAAESAHLPQIVTLLFCAATASVAGDLAAYRLAWRGGERFDRLLARNHRLATAQERLGEALVGAGGALVVLARFAPAGRSVVSLTAGVAHRRAREFLPWSALAGMAWAAYGVSVGYFGARWLGGAWHGTVVSVGALLAAGALAACILRRRQAVRQRSTAATKPAQAQRTGARRGVESRELEGRHV